MATTQRDHRIAFIAAAAVVCASSAALAATTQTFTVQATVSETCTIAAGSASVLNFGTYDPAASASTANANVLSVTCTNGGTTAQVTLNSGLNATTGATPERQMLNATHALTYKLFSDSAMHTEWNSNLASSPAITQDGNAHDLTVYGAIDPGQAVFVGTYTDTVTATVTF